MDTRPNKKSIASQAALCLAGAALALGMPGCGSRPHGGPVELIVGIDTSGSARDALGSWAYLTTRVSSRLDAGRDRLTLFRVAYETEEFCCERLEGEARIRERVLGAVSTGSSRAGTRPALFWRAALAEAERARSSSRRCVVMLLSDGQNDDMTEASACDIAESGRRLAAMPNVAMVSVRGAKPETFAALRRAFEPLGDRFQPGGPVGAEDVKTVTALIERAR